MRCSRCGRFIDPSEANEYYYIDKNDKAVVIPSADVDMYGSKVHAICQRCV